MSAFHDQPNHFIDWPRRRAPVDEAAPTAEFFVSRRPRNPRYGTYNRVTHHVGARQMLRQPTAMALAERMCRCMGAYTLHKAANKLGVSG